MPNRGVHSAAGIGAALAGGLMLAPKDMTPDDRFVFGLGLTLGGWVGSRMPDVIDPPLSPSHRSYAHGLLTAGGLVAGEWMIWVNHCRSKAAALRAEADACLVLAEAQKRRTQAGYCVFAAGAVLGFGLGYGSHLILDAFTTKGLPPIG